METEQTAELFLREHSELDEDDRYFRLNVRNGLENIGLEDSTQKDAIMTLTERYVQSHETFKLLRRCGKCLAERERQSHRAGSAVIFYYCERYQTEKHQAFELLASLLKQSLSHLKHYKRPCPKSLSTKLKDIFEYGRSEPDFGDLVEIFLDSFQILEKPTIILDGLDEMEYAEIVKVLGVFRQLHRKLSGWRLFISSREQLHHNINMAHLVPNLEHLRILHRDNADDICVYVKTMIAMKMIHTRQLTENQSLIEEMEHRLQAESRGIGICSALDNLPKDLDSTYNRCLQRIKRDRNMDHALKVFRWVSCTSRPLHIEELKEALAFTLEDTAWVADKIQSSNSVISRCGNLVAADSFDLCVRFIHPSVQHYLQHVDPSNLFHINQNKGQLECGEFSIRYLNFTDFSSQVQKPKTISFHPDVPGQVVGSTSSALGKLAFDVMGWTRYRTNQPLTSLVPVKPPLTATYGHNQLAQACLQNPLVEKYPTDDIGRSPLSCAAKNGHERIVQLLLQDPSVNLNHSDRVHRTPLSYAAKNGHDGTLQLLLQDLSSDELQFPDFWRRTPLSLAAERGHDRIVQLLIEHLRRPADIADNLQRTPLSYAAEKGHEKVVQLLLERQDIDMNRQDEEKRTPLSLAAENGHIKVAQLLLECRDIDIESKDKYDRTPLSYAAEKGHEKVVQLSVEQQDVDINSEDHRLQTPLSHAAEKGHENVVQMLLNCTHIDINSRDIYRYTPLTRATMNDCGNVVRLLSQYGAVL
ncbi:MAG: hypothetical protein Q9160_003511 [Pyrenula sp. 1 TL-2023]